MSLASSQVLPRRRFNPVYKKLSTLVANQYKALRAEYDAGGDLRDRLMKGNHGVRCFMRWQDIAGGQTGDQPDSTINALINEFRRNDTTVLYTSTDLAVNAALAGSASDVLVALYAPNTARPNEQPQANPTGTMYGGLPSELTDLAIRSDVLWHLKAPALYLADSNEMCKLHATTSFYLPSVEIRKESFAINDYYWDVAPVDPAESYPILGVTLTSDVQCVIDFWEFEGRQDVDVSRLIRSKLTIPLLTALRMNQNRKKLGLPVVRDVVIGDMNIPHRQHGINTLFSDRVKDVLEQFDGCFDSVTICAHHDTAMHLKTLIDTASDE